MQAFDVFLNGQRLCLAGIDGDSVLDVMITHLKHNIDKDELDLEVGGLVSATGEHVTWGTTPLKMGDEVRVTIAETDSADEPKARRPRNRTEEVEQKKQYVRGMPKELGWTLTESNPPRK
jgi:hypothetical protein